jgi:hypothetical protein
MAQFIVDQMGTPVSSASNTVRGEAGRSAIGFSTSRSTGNFRATLVEYTRRFPQIEISLI